MSVGLSASSIHFAVRKRTVAGGFHWFYSREGEPDQTEFRPSRIRPVCCVETGEIFSSATEAANALGTVVDNVRNSIYYGKAAKGKHFYYVGERPEKAKRSKRTAVRCIETGEIYASQAEACRKNNLPVGSLSTALQRGYACHDFHWEYVDSDKDNVLPLPQRKVKVVCYETEEVFDSISKAAEFAGVESSAIQVALRNKGFSGGFRWYRYGEERPKESAFIGKVARNRERKIVCYETGAEYPSVKILADELGIKAGSIVEGIKCSGTIKGKHYFYQDEGDPDKDTLRQRNNIQVRCIETGVVFDSLNAAIHSVGIKKHTEGLKKAIVSGELYHGYHWKYAAENEEVEK